MIQKLFIFSLPLFFLTACGVKGKPLPPEVPREIGIGKPQYKGVDNEAQQIPKKERDRRRVTIAIHKLVGAGNDFIFVDASQLSPSVDRKLLAKKICQRNWGVGADGLVVMKVLNLAESRFAWDFYNSDGSEAEMCGNAARCAVLYCKDQYAKQSCTIESAIGLLEGGFESSGEAFIRWQPPQLNLTEKTLSLNNGKKIHGYFVNTGVPHFVILVDKEEINGRDCLLIQENEAFGPARTNVTLLKVGDPGASETRSFERGVRDFTLACGTGVIASALVLQKLNSKNNQELQAPGGAMQVELNGSKVKLTGPAEKIFSGVF